MSYYLVGYFLPAVDNTDYESIGNSNFDIGLKHKKMHMVQHSSNPVTDLYNDPNCQNDTLALPENVPVAGCHTGECDNVTCRRIFMNDSATMQAVHAFMNKRTRVVLKEGEILQMASNCAEFRRRGGYRNEPIRASDVDFPIAFNILIHWHIEQFERLLRAIYRPQNVYCIHVDAKTSYEFHAAIKAVAGCFDNVFVATRLHRVVYEGFSRLQVNYDGVIAIVS